MCFPTIRWSKRRHFYKKDAINPPTLELLFRTAELFVRSSGLPKVTCHSYAENATFVRHTSVEERKLMEERCQTRIHHFGLMFRSNSYELFLPAPLTLLPTSVGTLTVPVLSFVLSRSVPVSLARKKKPPCTALPGTAITLWPKPFVRPAATWTLRTAKERHPS